MKSCVYFQRDFHAPWELEIEGTGFAQFHVITRGGCVVVADGRSHDCAAGDFLFIPRGQGHVLADRPGHQPLPGPQVMASFAGDAPCFAAGGAATRVICGHYEYRTPIEHPLLSDLPELVHIKTADVFGSGPGGAVLPLILQELAGEQPCQTLIVELCAETQLLQVLRLRYAQSGQRSGFYAGLADRRLERAIGRIHRDYV